MRSSSDTSRLLQLLARYTPDSRRWRRLVATAAFLGGALAVMSLFAVASRSTIGAYMLYNLIMFVFATLALALPAFGTATLLAPDSELTKTTATDRDGATETLKQRYAAGDISHEAFERRLDGLIENTDTEPTLSERSRETRERVSESSR